MFNQSSTQSADSLKDAHDNRRRLDDRRRSSERRNMDGRRHVNASHHVFEQKIFLNNQFTNEKISNLDVDIIELIDEEQNQIHIKLSSFYNNNYRTKTIKSKVKQ